MSLLLRATMVAITTFDFQNCFILILLCFFSLLCYSLFFKKAKNGLNLPPSPPSLPIIGHLHLLLSLLPHKSFQKISSKYGPLLYLRVFHIPIVLVSSASVAYEIFRTHDVNVSSRGVRIMDKSLWLGPDTFTGAPLGDYFKFMKKLLTMKLFGKQALEQSRANRAEELERFYLSLLNKAKKKERFDIRYEGVKLTNNVVCKMLMGRSCSEENGEAGRVRESVIKTLGLIKKVFLESVVGKTLKKVDISLFEKEITSVSNKFDELLERNLREHEKKPEEDEIIDMMDVLLAASRDVKAEYKISKNHIKLLFVELLVASSDTSPQTMQWAMAEIINKPSVLERLKQEIDTVVGKTRLIQEMDIARLPYLQAVVKETLRMHPSASLLVRMFEKECKVGGFSIPKKTTLVVNSYAVMRDPNVWEDPNDFKPERFLASSRSEQEEEEREKALNFLAFGSGRRSCPAETLGYIFVETVVAMMVQCFDWENKGDKVVNMEETVAGMSVTMAHPLNCTHLPRGRVKPAITQPDR